jgi:hypothetical protein
MLTQIVDVIGEIVEGAEGLYIKPTLIFSSGLASPGAVIFSPQPLASPILERLNIVIVEFLAKLKRKSNPAYTSEFVNAIKNEGKPVFEAAVYRTLENVGGKRLAHNITLLESKGERLAVMQGTLQALESELPKPVDCLMKYRGILVAHDVYLRRLKIMVGNRTMEIGTDFEKHHGAITHVLHVLMANVVVDVVESRRDDRVVSIELKDIAFDE